MTKNYICDLCNKEFKQKNDYVRHKNKKTACISADKLKKLLSQKTSEKINIDSLSSMFRQCLDILRDGEYLTGDKALRNLSYLLVLRLLEPKIGKELHFNPEDFVNEEYDLDGMTELLENVYFSKLAKRKESEIKTAIEQLWYNVLSEHPDTKDIYQLDGRMDIKRDSTYKKLVTTLANFEFERLPEDIQGHAYEQIIKDLMVGKILGQFFTQPIVKDMMVDLINPQVHDDGTIETIYDPAMGTAGFLKTSLFHLEKQASLKNINLDWDFIVSQGLGGRETEPDTFILAKSNMLVCSGRIFRDTITNADSIREPITEKYDIVLTNSPFGLKFKYEEITSSLRDEYLPIKTNQGTPLFIQAIIYMLKVGGRGAMVLPCGQELFSQQKALVAVREYLMKSCDLKEIIYLPSGVFTNTTIKTCVFYFHKKRECKDVIKASRAKNRTYTFSKMLSTKKVRFYDYDTERKLKTLIVEVPAEKIAENGYSLNHTDYMEKKEEEKKEYTMRIMSLGEVCTFKNGKQLSRKNIVPGDYPVIGGGKQPVGMHNQYNTEANTILCSSSGSAGYISLYPTKVWASDCFSIIPHDNINNNFLYYFLKNIQNVIYSKKTGIAQPHVYSKDVADINIPVPPLDIQEELVRKIDEMNERIQKMNSLKEAKLANIRDTIKMYIHTFTYWRGKRKLGDVCNHKIGKLTTKHKVENGKYPLYNGSSKSPIGYADEYSFDGEHYITIIKDGGAGENKYGDDIGLGKVFLVSGKSAATTSQVALFPKICNINLKYLYYYLQSQKNTIMDTAKYCTKLGHISIEKILNIPIPIPPQHVQHEIVEYCELMESIIKSLEKEPELNAKLIQGLMDSYLKRHTVSTELRKSSDGSVQSVRIVQTEIGDGFVYEEDIVESVDDGESREEVEDSDEVVEEEDA
jgi:type I restriction-modification system DNA methylase subunit